MALLQVQVILQFLFLILTLKPAATRVALDGCQDKCGNISIPYPFGIGDRCYLEDSYSVECQEPNKLFLQNSSVPVLDISLEGRLRVTLNGSHTCKDLRNNKTEISEEKYNFSRFAISVTGNKLTGVGCGGYANLVDLNNGTGSSILCETKGSKDIKVTEGTCSGHCCELSVPSNVSLFQIRTTLPSDSHCAPWDFSCHYAFLVEDGGYEFRFSDLHNLREYGEHPVLFDWWVGQKKCREVQEPGDVCKSQNSTCSDSINGPGYLCNCSEGYHGNPYIPDGCQDIDECEDQNLNNCLPETTCQNKIGNYTCVCPKGQDGDGRQNGTGCRTVQPQWKKILIGVVVGLFGTFVVILWVYWALRRRKIVHLKEKFFERNGGLLLQQQLSKLDKSRNQTRVFSAEELKKATENYHESKILGQGGQGTVYKGVLPNNQIVAIKKAKIGDSSQVEVFINEIFVLSQINHRNVVKLLGCCLETEVPLLVYEFVTNGTLYDYIHDDSGSFVLPWETRLKIATETANAVSYLHSAASIQIIHRDIKPANILLDDNFRAKVSDFGTSRLIPVDKDQLTTLVRGTLGYLDPEYFHTSRLNEKSDVYSFGVVLLELLTGEKALSFRRPESERHLVANFDSAMQEHRLLEILDRRILSSENLQELQRVADLAMQCLRLKGDERPTMKDVAVKLESLRALETKPEQKKMYHRRTMKSTNSYKAWTI